MASADVPPAGFERKVPSCSTGDDEAEGGQSEQETLLTDASCQPLAPFGIWMPQLMHVPPYRSRLNSASGPKLGGAAEFSSGTSADGRFVVT